MSDLFTTEIKISWDEKTKYVEHINRDGEASTCWGRIFGKDQYGNEYYTDFHANTDGCGGWEIDDILTDKIQTTNNED